MGREGWESGLGGGGRGAKIAEAETQHRNRKWSEVNVVNVYLFIYLFLIHLRTLSTLHIIWDLNVILCTNFLYDDTFWESL
jgi:hypothetical protein